MIIKSFTFSDKKIYIDRVIMHNIKSSYRGLFEFQFELDWLFFSSFQYTLHFTSTRIKRLSIKHFWWIQKYRTFVPINSSFIKVKLFILYLLRFFKCFPTRKHKHRKLGRGVRVFIRLQLSTLLRLLNIFNFDSKS